MDYSVQAGCEPFSAPGDGARGAIAIVISHGFTGNPSSMRPLADALAGKGFAIELVRWPGHGTHWKDMARTRYADWRGEVERAINVAHKAGKRVIVCGLSLGATVALDLACARPDALVGAVWINGALLDREGVAAKLAPAVAMIMPALPASAAGLAKNDIAKGGKENAYAWVPLKAATSIKPELPRIRDAVAKLAIPMLVAYSPQDHSVPAENSRALLRMLAGKDATELVLERSYHVATLDYDFELLVDSITAFADRVASTGASTTAVSAPNQTA